MHILILSPWYPSLSNSVHGVFVQEQASVLAERHQVTVVQPMVQETAKSWGTFRYSLEHARKGNVDSYQVVGRNWLPGIPMGFELSVQHMIKWALHRIGLDAGQISLIHAHVLWPVGYGASELARSLKVPLVITEHQCPFSLQLQTVASRHCVRKAAMRADRLFAVSPSLQKEMQGAGIRRPIEVVPNVIDTGRFAPAPRSSGDTCRLLFVGELTDRKGVPWLLRAVGMMRQAGDDVRLDLVGMGSEKARYQQMAADLGIADRCRFVGPIAPEKLPEHYAACDIFVLPSLAETFGVVLLEAVGSGRPVVATRCGGPESFFQPYMGEMTNPGQAEDLARAIRAVWGRREEFDPAQMHQEVEVLYGRQAFADRLSRIYSELR